MRKLFLLIFLILFSLTAGFGADLRFAQISDVRYKSDDNSDLAKVISAVNKQKNVSFVVFTGDNINKPDVKELEAFLKEAKKLHCPYYIVLGEHDLNKRKDLGKKEYLKILRKSIRGFKEENPFYMFEKKGVIFIVADGSKEVIPDPSGYYRDTVLDWVKTELDNSRGKNVIVLQHYPLIAPASKESYYTYKADKYLRLLKKYPNVKAVVSGHFGVNNEIISDGITHISTAPPPYFRIIDIIDCETSSPTIWAQLIEAE